MCLYTSEESPSYAKEDIKVYKVLTRANHGPYAIRYTYHHGSNVPLFEDILMQLNNESPMHQIKTIDKGYLHAWKHLSDALNFAAAWQDYDGEFRVVEMYIPKGATYYQGDNGDIAASKLVWHIRANEYNTRERLNKENE